MDPKQLNEVFLGLMQRIGQGGNREESRREEPAKPPEPINYKELLDPTHDNFNPEQAFKSYVEQNYGNLIGDINKRSIKGMFGNFRNQIHDFADFESDIEKSLESRNPSELSDKDVIGAYFTLKGARTYQKERADRAKQTGSTTHQPSPANEPSPNDIVLDDSGKEVAQMMFGHTTDPQAEYKKWKQKSDQGPMELKVPLGDGKTG